MRKLFQTAWHGIPFGEFCTPSSSRIADATFYERFYASLFQHYVNPDALDPKWVRLKHEIAAELEKQLIKPANAHILSVGCGLGIMEMKLLEDGYTNLEVTEVAEAPLKWLRQTLRPERIHVGSFPNCVPKQLVYDIVLLASVDYFLDDKQLIACLSDAFTLLQEGGHCTLISHSLDCSNSLLRLAHHMRDGLASLLGRLSLRDLGQLWGYQRTPQEYRQAFRLSGFTAIEEELMATQTHWTTYRMTGFKRSHSTERLN